MPYHFGDLKKDSPIFVFLYMTVPLRVLGLIYGHKGSSEGNYRRSFEGSEADTMRVSSTSGSGFWVQGLAFGV